jgi:DeoR family fructose operon transcriptional repressor
MEIDGVLTRTHGGAVFNAQYSKDSTEYPLNIREIQRFAEKDHICKRAATLIQAGDTIFIDNSSTCIFLIKYIPVDFQVTIITNSIKVILESLKYKNSKHLVVCLGGFINESNLSTYGNIAQKNAAEFYPNKAFMSCAGIHPPDQVVDTSILEVDTKRLMIERSKEVILLADHSKFGKNGNVFLADFDSIDVLITDNQAKADQLKLMGDAGIRTLVAD